MKLKLKIEEQRLKSRCERLHLLFLLIENNTKRKKCFKNVKSYTLVFLSEVFESLCEVFRKEEEVF